VEVGSSSPHDQVAVSPLSVRLSSSPIPNATWLSATVIVVSKVALSVG
jgi:hypothetical protein